MARQHPEINRAIGTVLRDARTKRGLTQEALASRCELHVTYISQLERGLKSPSLVALMRIANALDVRASELIRATEQSLGRT